MKSWCIGEVRALTQGPKFHYFGYYDKFPYDETGRYLLALETDFQDRPPAPDDVARIGVIDLQGKQEFEQVAETRAFNWQQGTHLQWLPGGNARTIIYNLREGDRYVSCVHDLDSGERRLLPLPVYAVSHDGKQALSLNFSRLHDCRPGYGYNGIPDPHFEVLQPTDDGIFRMDLTTGEAQLVLSIAQVAAIETTKGIAQGKNRFNHVQYSTDDKRFVFLHRWAGGGGKLFTVARLRKLFSLHGLKRGARQLRKGGLVSHTTRMFTANPDGSDLYLLNADDMTSHFDWRDGSHLLAWARRHGVGDRYFLFTDKGCEVEILGDKVLDSDGHCTYSPDRKFVLTDTYPQGPDNLRTIIIYNLATGERTDVGGFHSLPEYEGEIRCDLHPRWNRDGRKVCFDSMHEGMRQIYEIDVTDVVSQ